MNIGEELVAAYLQHIKGCEFTQQNLYTPDVQGEIDVVGIDLSNHSLYVCEVAIHLVTGLKYTKNKRPNNVEKLTEKFSRDIEYARKFFPEYQQHFMLWSPIIRASNESAAHNQEKDLRQIRENIAARYGVSVEFVVNEDFQRRIDELRQYVRSKTEELKNPVLRLLQIEEALQKHLGKKSRMASQ
ncbi:MAG: hypothetical protein OHM77_06390 [Candidatus Nitricoxidivorans perseverans]|uniref:Uncharacterized protein n=1 Tax=Candidatus Nitricoxidivorans perseverans TaxID=2975601 RepID=A0AA49FN31_9PROT|nr:MAG: hypothetical protein OHM77_06390 [Candidatus Nitricoxidivorans perseverans]